MKTFIILKRLGIKKNGIGSSDGLMLDKAPPSTPEAPSDISVSVLDVKDNEKY